jgi:hypothetical protein
MDIEGFPNELMRRCLEAVGGLQRDFANLLGISDRTMSRWLGEGMFVLQPGQLNILARSVFAADPALAAEVAARGGTTLQALGLGVRPPAATPPSLPPAVEVHPPAPAPLPASAALLDSIVCAGADLHGYPTGHIRAIVAATFARAQELGLTTEAVAKGFASLEPAKKTEP